MSTRPSRYERTLCVRRGWVFERAGWAAMATVTLAAIAGLLGGSGLYSETHATLGTDLTVRYGRFTRAHAPHELVVEWLPRDSAATFWIARSYLDAMQIERVAPAPDFTEIGASRVYYTFRMRERGARIAARFTLEPTRAGRIEARIGLDDGREIVFRQFAFP